MKSKFLKKAVALMVSAAIVLQTGLVMPLMASAKSELYAADWSALSDTVAITDLGDGWNLTGSNLNLTVEDGVLNAASQANNNNNYLYYQSATIEAAAGKVYRYEFDFKTNTGNNTSNNSSQIATSKTNSGSHYNDFGSSKHAADLGMTDTSKTYAVAIVIDNINKKAAYYAKESGAANYEQKSLADLSEVNNGIIYRTGRNRTDNISNFKVYELTMPTVSVKNNDDSEIKDAKIETEAEATYKVTSSDANTVSAESDNTEVATATVADGVLTVKGVADGKATITVTAAGEDDYEKATQSFEVTVGSPKEVQVIVNYYITDTTDAVPTLTQGTFTKIVDDTIVAEDLTLADVVQDDAKYVYNENASNATALPYTVVGENNVINVYFDKILKAGALTVNCKAGDTVIQTITPSVADKYTGDKFTYSYPAYIVKDNNIYKVDATAYGKEVELKSETITEDVEYAVYKENTVAAFIEGEDISGSTVMVNTGDNRLSGLNAKRGWSKEQEFFTAAEKGIYKVTLRGYSNNVNSDRTFEITKNSTKVEEYSLKSISINAIKDFVAENVELNEGDKLGFKPSDGQVSIDYILIEKTGELPATISGTVDAGVKSVTLTKKGEGNEPITGTIDGTTATFKDVEPGEYTLGYELNDEFVLDSELTTDITVTVDNATAFAIKTKAKTYKVAIKDVENIKSARLEQGSGENIKVVQRIVKADNGGKIEFDVPKGTYKIYIACEDGFKLNTAAEGFTRDVVVEGDMEIELPLIEDATEKFAVVGTVGEGVESVTLVHSDDKFEGEIADGKVTFNVPAGEYEIEYELKAGYVADGDVAKTLTVTEADNNAFTINTKIKTYTVSGTAPADKVEKVALTLKDDEDAKAVEATVEENGTFSFADVAPGSYTITYTLKDGVDTEKYDVVVKVGDTAANVVEVTTADVTNISVTVSEKTYDDKTVKAELIHTLAQQGGSNTAGKTVDLAEHYYNNWGAESGWIATVYSQFGFNEADLPEKANAVVSAKLTFKAKSSRGTYTMDVANVALDTIDLTGEQADWIIPMLAKPTVLKTFSLPATYTECEADVTAAVKNMIANGEKEVLFAFSGGAAGGNIYGKGAAEADQPKLEIVISTKPAVEYTLKYVDADGTELKNVTKDGFVGMPFGAEADDKKDFTLETKDEDGNVTAAQKYIYVSGGDVITLTDNAENNVITLTYKAAGKYKVTVNAKGSDEADLGKVGEAEVFEGDSVKIPYARYIVKDSKVYFLAAGASIDNEYNKQVAVTNADVTETLNYALQSDIESVYFSEAEDIDGFTDNDVSNAGIRCSMGKGGDIEGEDAVTLATLPAGKYKVYVGAWGGGKTDESQSTYTFTAGETSVMAVTTTGSHVPGESAEFTVDADTVVKVAKTTAGTSMACLDYIMVVKVNETPATPSPSPSTDPDPDNTPTPSPTPSTDPDNTPTPDTDPVFDVEKAADGKVQIKANAANDGGYAYIVTYAADGSCTSIKIVELPKAKDGTAQSADTVPAGAKVFVWKADMTPYCSVVTIQ